MGAGYWLRVMVMIISLAGVVWSMRKLNTGKTEVQTQEGPLSLCNTRIRWVESGSIHLEEHNTHWMRTVNAGTMEEVSGPEAEKWFSRLCSAKLELVKAEGEFRPSFKLGYVSGTVAEVTRSAAPGAEFKLNNQTFKSEGVDEALRTLPNLPEAPKPGHP